MLKRAFIDMDDVLADFIGGILKVHGWTPEKLEEVHDRNRWSVIESMGMTEEEFWEPVRRGSCLFSFSARNFWAHLAIKKFAWDVLNWAESIADEWYILSAPQNYAECYAGKVNWIQQYLGDKFENFILTKHKTLFAGEGTLLVDDRKETVEAFREAGGIGIVYPTRYNRLSSFVDDPITYLEKGLHNALMVS